MLAEVRSAKSVVVNKALQATVDGKTQSATAINEPNLGVITIDSSDWQELSGENQRQPLAVHEALSLMKIESTGDYHISAALENVEIAEADRTILAKFGQESTSSSNHLGSYQSAVLTALLNQQFTCTFSQPGIEWIEGGAVAMDMTGTDVPGEPDIRALHVLVSRADKAQLNNSGRLPILTFYIDWFYNQAIAFTPSADQKSILSIDFTQYLPIAQRINLGTITNPKIVTCSDPTNLITASCKQVGSIGQSD